MPNKTISFEKVRTDLEDLEFDENLADYKQELLKEIQPERMIVLKNQFFYLMDMQTYECILVHPNIQTILGYPPSFLKTLKDIFSLIHPEDHDFVLAFSKKSISFSREITTKKLVQIDPYSISFSIDHRMRKSDGNYIRLDRQTSCAKTDRKGNMVYAIAVYTDISHQKHKQYISCSCSGDELGLFSVDDIRKNYFRNKFTPREIEIIKMLADGMEGREIGDKLCISTHTVTSHRKAILKKTGASNSAELVKYAIENGII